ncbi:unnamed protein product [Rotaria sordida]|uniref:Uncharacterized protein n=1 Tax=Rotaria sordida TaxID=392033 RepID=A0A814MN33_9BILA|nr:unnamed protein product [Rotaria sordida]
MQDKQHSPSIINDGSSLLDDDACDYQEYHDDEHDDTKTAIDIEYCFLDRFPPFYNGCRVFSMKSMKLLMDFLTSDVCLDKQNILCLLKLIKFLLSEPNTLPTTSKSIIKLFERTNLSSTTFLHLLCHE